MEKLSSRSKEIIPEIAVVSDVKPTEIFFSDYGKLYVGPETPLTHHSREVSIDRLRNNEE